MNIYKKVMLSCLPLFSVQSHGMALLVGAATGLATSIGVPHYLKSSNKRIVMQCAALFVAPIAVTMPFKCPSDAISALTLHWVGNCVGSLGMGITDALYSDKSKMSIAGELGVSFCAETLGFLVVIMSFRKTWKEHGELPLIN